ncbi:MAG TPA: DUF433 domain-containing protein [Thermoanaerobaculia bacterium]|nr:DUF433 domain-containing protein [Thermoanaerobaculia bacterium]
MDGTPRIVSTPGVCGGKPRLDGHRVRVLDVVAWHEILALSAEEIALIYPALTLADVEAALAYYAAHRDEVQRDLALEPELVAELEQAHRSLLAAKARPLHRLRLDAGRIHLPAELRLDLGVTDGEHVVVERVAGGVYRLESLRRSQDRIRQEFEELAGHPSLAKELLAERRAEARRDEEDDLGANRKNSAAEDTG